MALSEDQKAMLRLLAQRGEQGYEDIAALKGIDVDEVHDQVRDAVRQLEDEGLPPPAIPVEPGPARTSASGQPPAPAPEEKQPPKPKVEPPRREPPPPGRPEATAGPTADRPKISFPSDPGARGALAVGALIVVALVVILLVSGGEGDSDTTGTTASSTNGEAATETPVTDSKEITKAVLSPVDGSDAAGSVIFGRVKNTLALQVLASGLEPTAKGEAYAIWLAQSPRKMLPLAATAVGKTGKIAARFNAPIEILGYLANETFKDIAITLVDEKQLSASIDAATESKESPTYTGTEVLRGTVTGPIVGAANRGEDGE